MVRFQYDRTNLDFQTRNPLLGNTDILEFTRISRRTIGGDDIIFRDSHWPRTEVIHHAFDFPTCDPSVALMRRLIDDSLGDYFTYTDFCGRNWTALVRNPDTAISQPGIDTITISLELEITLAPLETPVLITSFPIGGSQQPTVYVGDTTNEFDLYELNADTQFEFPGSVIKLMTLLLAYEYKSSVWNSELITISVADVTDPFSGLSSSAGFQAGDITTFEGLAYGLLLPSGFDACQAIARVIGDTIYLAAGNTGTQGMTRFIERMNSRGTELGLIGTTFTDPFGGSKTFLPTVVRNVTTARDLAKYATAAFANLPLRTIAQSVTHNVVVSGSNPRTITMTNFSRFINGPTNAQAGITDTTVIASKNGVWITGGTNNYCIATLWTSPVGYEIVIVTLGSKSLYAGMLDQRGLMYSMPRDFSYLQDTSVTTDAYISSVRMLIGADNGSIIDETGRTLVISGATVGNPVNDTEGGILFDANADVVYTVDASDITVGSGNMTVEMWFAGPGTTPSGEIIFFGKFNHVTNQREWLINGFFGNLNIFASADGASFTSVTALAFGDAEQTFYNGAPRNLAYIKNGSTWALYVDGERMANTITVGTAFNGTAPLAIGYVTTAEAPIGRVDDFRATFGIARYTDTMHTISSKKLPRS